MRLRLAALEGAAVVLLFALFLYVQGVVLRDLTVGVPVVRREITSTRLWGLGLGAVAAGTAVSVLRPRIEAHLQRVLLGVGAAVILLLLVLLGRTGALTPLLGLSLPPLALVGEALVDLFRLIVAVGFVTPVWLGTYAILQGGLRRVRIILLGLMGLVVWSRLAAKFFELTPAFDPLVLVLLSVGVVLVHELTTASEEGRATLAVHAGDASVGEEARAALGALVTRQATFLVITGLLLTVGSLTFLTAARGEVLPAAAIGTTRAAFLLLALLLVPLALLGLLLARRDRSEGVLGGVFGEEVGP